MSTETVKNRGTFVGEVLANEPLCAEHYRLVLGVAGFPPSRPGQFVQLQCRSLAEPAGAREVEYRPDRVPVFTQPELTHREPLLRRPFSLAGRENGDGAVRLEIIYRTVGVGTGWLAEVKAGERLSVLGPLGNEFAIRADQPAAALVGGGAGIPPLLYLADTLSVAGKNVVAFCGARSADLLPLTLAPDTDVSAAGEPAQCTREFSAFGVPTAIATDDGSLGRKGFVSEALTNWLGESHAAGELVVYSCGPEAMMRAVADICIARDIECQLALERHMACGMGTCQSCIVKIRDEIDSRDDTEEKGWSYKLCCTDGPVFNASDVVW